MFDYRPFLPEPLRALSWQPHPLDGELLLFERDSGLNLLLEGEETAYLRRIAPRTLLIAVTNVCNLTCDFCYRDLTSPSAWTYDSLLEFCQQADEWGVLEVAFGGGEPTLFPRWAEFIEELYATTKLCINFTTNGTRLTADFLQQIAGKYGQIRLSLYEDNHWRDTVRLLVEHRARFGVNWLITPDALHDIETMFAELLQLGVRDFLLLSYKGSDATMHLNPAQRGRLEDFLNDTNNKLGAQVSIKLDVCWGDALCSVPRLFERTDCGAGDDFLSITSDKHIKPCSFHPGGIPFDTLADVQSYWTSQHLRREVAPIAGCARLQDRGLSRGGHETHESLDLAAV